MGEKNSISMWYKLYFEENIHISKGEKNEPSFVSYCGDFGDIAIMTFYV